MYLILDVLNGEKLTRKCVYFLRNTANKPVNKDVYNDQDVISGELMPNVLQSLDTALSEVYAPILAGKQAWGKIHHEKEKSAFLNQVNKFHVDLSRRVLNLSGDLQVETPRAGFDRVDAKAAAYKDAAKNPAFLREFVRVVNSWRKSIQEYLDNDISLKPLDPANDEGPEVEIDYWSRRMLTLISITEQLGTRQSRVVLGTLKVHTIRGAGEDWKNDPEISQEAVQALMEAWYSVDLCITDALNEAKDNVRFLDNLQKVIEPLYTESPAAIADSIPAIMNSMKMIHTLSRHYGTEVRMTNLFQRMTNQLIKRCKQDIYNAKDKQELWDQDPKVVIAKMDASLNLCDRFYKCYKETSQNLAEIDKGKQFNFDENAIFGKFIRFKHRLEKLKDMFSSIEQFQAIENKRIDGMEELIQRFKTLIQKFRSKGHDILDFSNTVFERDFIEFTMHNSGLEHAIQTFIEQSISQPNEPIDSKLEKMKRFKDVLHRPSLVEQLDQRYVAIFRAYGDDLSAIQALFESHVKEMPPIPRNMTKIAGCIQWSRQLLRRVTGPMRQFQEQRKVFHQCNNTRSIREQYNRLCNQLIEYESIWFQAWQRSTEQAKKGLRSHLIVENPKTHKLYVNFDQNVLMLMREARYLQVIGFEIPNSAKMVLLLEDKLRKYYAEISHILTIYNRLVESITPKTRALLDPHLSDLDNALSPAIETMTWTSMNIDSFLTRVKQALARFEALVTQINDITTNRIEKNLRIVAESCLLDLPSNRTFNYRTFASEQSRRIEAVAAFIAAKNEEVDIAVRDLITILETYSFDSPNIHPPSKDDTNMLRIIYCGHMYHAILQCVRNSIAALRNRLIVNGSIYGVPHNGAPLFEIDVTLQDDKIALSPEAPVYGKAINEVIRNMLTTVGRIRDWGVDDMRQKVSKPFSDRLLVDRSVARSLFLLFGAFEETAIQTARRAAMFNSHSKLWENRFEEDSKSCYDGKKANVDKFVARLESFVALEVEIKRIPNVINLGSVAIRNVGIKQALVDACQRWKHNYAEALHQEAKAAMLAQVEHMSRLRAQLERPLQDLAALKHVMDAQREIREMQASIEFKFAEIMTTYEIVEKYLAPRTVPKEEMDVKSVLRADWNKLIALSDKTQAEVLALQDDFRNDLIEQVANFKQTIEAFEQDYSQNGPNVPRILPSEAMSRVNKYKREVEVLRRNYEKFNAGEKLFGLPENQYPALNSISRDIEMLDKLYKLYDEVMNQVEHYNNVPWSDVVLQINEMEETINDLRRRCVALPKGLKEKKEGEWSAYHELYGKLDDLAVVLPLLQNLASPAMRQRHWDEISTLTGTKFDMEHFADLKLKQVLDANLREFKDDIEDITTAAEKQAIIEAKFKAIKNDWEIRKFEFAVLDPNYPDVQGFDGTCIRMITTDLEEAQSTLNQMLTQRQVTPFKEEIILWLEKLSSVIDVLERWVKVQQVLKALLSVFRSGDIARQLPSDTRIFQKWDKEWTQRLMSKAKDVRTVVDCCQNEYIRDILPAMAADLDKCEKALEGYLEAKRSKFPRLYFVSQSKLLEILSQASDREKVQQCFSKVFDSINRVELQGTNITKIITTGAIVNGRPETEVIPLLKPVQMKGNIEEWLTNLLREMVRAMKEIIRQAAGEYESTPVIELVRKYPGQVALLAIQFLWTSQCTDYILRSRTDKSMLYTLADRQQEVLKVLTGLVMDENFIRTSLEKLKIQTLILIQVHQYDVIMTELLQRVDGNRVVHGTKAKLRRRDITDFEWQRQLRCYWSVEDDNCVVRIADSENLYSYEYLGCKERLVVTNLTDRCYISLTQALSMGFGGAPAGPAGTGKTETVKDLGRALGKYVCVFNCAPEWTTKETQKLYKGICQSGAWGCFDEFNRITLEVLSVLAQQIQIIFNGIRSEASTVYFPADEATEKLNQGGPQRMLVPVALDPKCGIFITMNPGYAGRQELPENLKALFRSVAMMVPDTEVIIRVKLTSVGYQCAQDISKKFDKLYKLCAQQLSKQRHYDFGLRNILSVLRTAGANLKHELHRLGTKELGEKDRLELESRIMMRTLRDMNLAKLAEIDFDLFNMLLRDIFVSLPMPENHEYEVEEPAIREVIASRPNIVFVESWFRRIVQFYETSLVRHGLMMMGPAGCGKTTAMEVLAEALTRLERKTVIRTMNPKAIDAQQMYGVVDPLTNEWTSGVFSEIWMAECVEDSGHNSWIVCDGPVDALWIENLNTVLDDNKVLTLPNNDRITMTSNVRLVFEVQNLDNASPATVSRAGIVCFNDRDLGFQPYIDAWLNERRNEIAQREDKSVLDLADCVNQIAVGFSRFLSETNFPETFRREYHPIMTTAPTHPVANLCALLNALIAAAKSRIGALQGMHYFIFAFVWAYGGLLEEDKRRELHNYVVSRADPEWLPPFETKADGGRSARSYTIFDYNVDLNSHEWVLWKPRVWQPDPCFKFTTALIPTVESFRTEYLITLLQDKDKGMHQPVLILGSSGTAKSSVALQYARSFETKGGPTDRYLKRLNFSFVTTHNLFQASLEADLEKGMRRNVRQPLGQRWMTILIDDLSLPEVNMNGDQPTLELVRQVVETNSFYSLDRDKRGEKIYIEKVLYLGAMNHPGGGHNDIPHRLKRHFFTINLPPPTVSMTKNIYGSILRHVFGISRDLEPIIDLIDDITEATMTVWSNIRMRLLPTPSRFHYIFNLRDLSRIFQGMLQAPVNTYLGMDRSQMQVQLIRLWHNECERVFADKLVTNADKMVVLRELHNTIHDKFKEHSKHFQLYDLLNPKSPENAKVHRPHFVNFLRDPIYQEETGTEYVPLVYEEAPPGALIRQKVAYYLDKYNATPHAKKMNLVIFDDALEHLVRISRIIGTPRGSAMLVGVGGSGRQSLARLAASINQHRIHQIQLTSNYRCSDFLDEIRKLYEVVGKNGHPTTWILTDFEIIDEQFLEYINLFLSTGEISGLFNKDMREGLCADMAEYAKKEDPSYEETSENNWRYFINRVRDNLHIVLCFTPSNEKFAVRARRFPAVFNNCTIDWFMGWPEAALVDVATRFLVNDSANFHMEAAPEVQHLVANFVAHVHTSVLSSCEAYMTNYRRQVHVTPKMYLSYISSFKKTYSEKYEQMTKLANNVARGLERLKEVEADVAKLKDELAAKKIELQSKDESLKVAMVEIAEATARAREQEEHMDRIKAERAVEAKNVERDMKIVEEKRDKVLPFVERAKAATKNLDPPKIREVQSFQKPPVIIKLLMDCILLLLQRPVVPAVPTQMQIDRKTEEVTFIQDSYDGYAKAVMAGTGFAKTVETFAEGEEKDKINDETMEFLEPYLNLKNFNGETAAGVAAAGGGMYDWVRSMFDYHNYSKDLIPLLDDLRKKENELKSAESRLAAADEALREVKRQVEELSNKHHKLTIEKKMLAEDAARTEAKMEAASNLVLSLADEKRRWDEQKDSFANSIARLVGDCAIACAFISYLGPFNFETRRQMLHSFTATLASPRFDKIPFDKDLNLTSFLADPSQVAEWNQEGLPKDELSIQNGILVTQADRFPLLIDPQGQALKWVRQRCADRLPAFGTTTFNHPNLRDQLESAMAEGATLIIEGNIKNLDPIFDVVLEKQYTKRVLRGRESYAIMWGERALDYDRNFNLFMVTKLANPVFTPELSAKTTIIDFSVTQSGLEDQLLSDVINVEQRELEEKRLALIAELNENTIAKERAAAELLEKLSSASGSRLLDDTELIEMLHSIKKKSQEAKEREAASVMTEISINKKREQYRSVARRGSILYFVIVSLAQINSMYQYSLDQFLEWFQESLEAAEKATNVAVRVDHLSKYLTLHVYKQVNMGLFEKDKLTFRLIMALRIMKQESKNTHVDFDAAIRLLITGGQNMGFSSQLTKNVSWITPSVAVAINAITTLIQPLQDLRLEIEQRDKAWLDWATSASPEAVPPPLDRFKAQDEMTAFYRFLVTRAFRPDCARVAATNFVGAVLGEKFVEPMETSFEDLFKMSNPFKPILIILTPGADPTSKIEELARQHGIKIHAVSMGQGQSEHARRAMDTALTTGGWALFQNCHLGIDFMESLESRLADAEAATFSDQDHKTVHENARIWITCEPSPKFPVSVLQMSIKITNEPPRGMKAGLLRSFTTLVDAKTFSSIDTKEWRDIVASTCYLHSVVQERRKYDAIGWCIPYEFSTYDLEASIRFLEKHFLSNQISWDAVRYMICQVQYGGRITDDFDRRLFGVLGDFLLITTEHQIDKAKEELKLREEKDRQMCITLHNLPFALKPANPDVTHEDYLKAIKSLPTTDKPDIFGLHQNTEFTVGENDAREIFNVLQVALSVQLSSSSSESKSQVPRTREAIVAEKCAEYSRRIPRGYDMDVVMDCLRSRRAADVALALGGDILTQIKDPNAMYVPREGESSDMIVNLPLNLFLFQEILRLQKTIATVTKTLKDLYDAIMGEIIMTSELETALEAIYQDRPPIFWYVDNGGAQIAWHTPSLPLWIEGLRLRENQLSGWLYGMRPASFWFTGFYNPLAFITAARQEAAHRMPKTEPMVSLDEIVTRMQCVETKSAKAPNQVPIHSEPGAYFYATTYTADHPDEFPRVVPWQKSMSPTPDVYIHGLYLEGAQLQLVQVKEKEYRYILRDPSRESYYSMPIMSVTAIPAAQDNDPKSQFYECPIYTRKRRTNLNYVMTTKLRTDVNPKIWTVRGVALLSSTD